ncbi:prepilin-type N-terminal cleavage/methylation domain-containing protein [Opitutaceae bacterium TAV1]|nr:prepilin-type N-terminal cleavage/methylation domain-containing protein [Opitutaceae bacterium TAV1]
MKTSCRIRIRAAGFCRGFTLVELLVVIAIIGILAAIIIPTVGKVRETAYAAQCASNLRQVFNLYMLSVQDNRGRIPPDGPTQWIDAVVQDYGAAGKYELRAAFGCPVQIRLKPLMVKNDIEVNKRAHRTYSINRDLTRELATNQRVARDYNHFQAPSRTVCAGDGNDSDNDPTYYNALIGTGKPPETPHNGKANILYLDGHVAALADQTLLNVPNRPTPGTPQAMFWFGE